MDNVTLPKMEYMIAHGGSKFFNQEKLATMQRQEKASLTGWFVI